MSKSEFKLELDVRSKSMAWPEALVFIHGYNNSFDDAARRAAQLGHDLEFGGIVAFFSWPSAAGSLDYTRDKENAEYASLHLKEFLEQLARDGNLTRIHLVAHSMGNQCLIDAARAGLDLGPCQIDECILASPDVDAQIYQNQFAKLMLTQVSRLTMYASTSDKALIASRLPNGQTRLGDANPIVVIPGMESIDVSNVNSDWMGHSTFAANPLLIKDIRQMIEDDLPAALRTDMLERNVGATMKYWELVPSNQSE